jgi:selenocysteine lyase/cysteine desulfurase
MGCDFYCFTGPQGLRAVGIGVMFGKKGAAG